METKQCGICKKEFPKTLEYFNRRTQKQKLANGEIAIYESFRYACRICLNKKIAKLKKEEYHKDIEKSRQIGKIKYWKDPESRKKATARWRDNNKQYLLEQDRLRVKNLDDSWVCSSLKIKMKDCPKELLETTKTLILLKRELKQLEQLNK